MDALPCLETERLILRPLTRDDIYSIHLMLDDYDVSRDLLNIPHPYPRSAAEDLVTWSADAAQRDEYFLWGVAQRDDNPLQDGQVLVGSIFLRPQFEHRRAEIGYWIGQAYWGAGYATEAAQILVDYGFRSLNLNRIYALCFTENLASARVLQKAGLFYEGKMRQDVMKAEGFRDVAVFGLLRSDYDAREVYDGGY